MAEIRKASEADISSLVNLHSEIFNKTHFTSYFSKSLLRKYFQKLISKNNYCFVAYNASNNLEGYIISGNKTTEAVNEFINENRLAILKVLLLHPKFLFEKIFYFIFGRAKHTVSLRLLFIGVRPGMGLGIELLEYYEKAISLDGLTEYGLSVRSDNKKAIEFYKKNGFIFEKRIFNSISYTKKLRT
ncbi:MAG TPA: N-acetyltransferase [Ignavibacteriaceae bacterium]